MNSHVTTILTFEQQKYYSSDISDTWLCINMFLYNSIKYGWSKMHEIPSHQHVSARRTMKSVNIRLNVWGLIDVHTRDEQTSELWQQGKFTRKRLKHWTVWDDQFFQHRKLLYVRRHLAKAMETEVQAPKWHQSEHFSWASHVLIFTICQIIGIS